MEAQYNKVIIVKKDGEIKAVGIFDEQKHCPVFFSVGKMGMDDIIEMLGTRVPAEDLITESTVIN